MQYSAQEISERYTTAYDLNTAMGVILPDPVTGKSLFHIKYFVPPILKVGTVHSDEATIYNTVWNNLTKFACLDYDVKKYASVEECYTAMLEDSKKLDKLNLNHDICTSSTDEGGNIRGFHLEAYFRRPQNAAVLHECLRKVVPDKRVEVWPNNKLIRLSFVRNGNFKAGTPLRKNSFNMDARTLVKEHYKPAWNNGGHTFKAGNVGLERYIAAERKQSSRLIANYTRDYLNRLGKYFHELTEEELAQFHDDLKWIHERSVTGKTQEYFLKEAAGWARNHKKQVDSGVNVPTGMNLLQYLRWNKNKAKKNKWTHFVLRGKKEYAKEQGVTVQTLNRWIRQEETNPSVNLKRVHTGGWVLGDSNVYEAVEQYSHMLGLLDSVFLSDIEPLYKQQTDKYRTLIPDYDRMLDTPLWCAYQFLDSS